jgi:hypothetical protein
VFFFVGCANSLVPDVPDDGIGIAEPSVMGAIELEADEIADYPQDDAVGVQIALANEKQLGAFDYIHEFDYMLVRESVHGFASDILGDTLVIWTDIHVRDFSVISVGHDFIDDELFFIPIEVFGQVDNLPPGMGFVINSYISLGTMPWSGITFVDENDVKRYFTILQDQSDEFPPYRLIEFEDRTSELPPDWRPPWSADN